MSYSLLTLCIMYILYFCAKFLWNLFNSDNVLFSRICRYSVYNSDTAMGENIRYFMYKYNISYNDWYGNLSNIYVKIDTHVRSITNYDNICIAGAIRELCEARDSGVPQFVDATQLCVPNNFSDNY